MVDTKLSDEQIRLVNFLKDREHTECAKTTIWGLFSKATIQSLVNKGLVGDNYSRGTYQLTASSK